MLMWFTLPDDGKTAAVDVADLFDAHAVFLHRHATRLLGAGPHVDDVVQNTFLIAHQKRETLTPGPELRGWLLRVLANVVAHEKRSFARRSRLSDALASASSTTTGPADADADGQAVWATLRQLPYAQAEAMVLFEFDGLSVEAIAELQGVREGTVYSRISKGRAAFLALWHVDDVDAQASLRRATA